MAAPLSKIRRWAEVLLTSLVAALTVWDSFPDGTAKARIVRAAIAAALGPVLVYLRHGRGTRAVPAADAKATGGFATERVLGVLALLAALVLGAMLASLAGCASSSQSAGVLHEATSSSSDEHAASSADVTDHVEDHSQERIDENVVTTTSGGAIDLDVVTTKPDGTKIEKHLHRAPVEVKRDASTQAAVQKALTEDAHAVLAGTDDKHDQAAATKQAASTKSNKSAPAIGCQLGGLVSAVGIAVAIAGIIVYALRRAKRAASAIDPLP